MSNFALCFHLKGFANVPADVAISSCRCWFCSQWYLWWLGEPDGDLGPPCKNGFFSLQPNQFFPIWLIAQPWGKLCQYRGGVMWRWDWVPRGVWEDERWFLSSFPAAYETTGWATATPCAVVSFYIFQHFRFSVACSLPLSGLCCFVLEIPALSACTAACLVHGRSVAWRTFRISCLNQCYTGLRLGPSSRGCPLSLRWCSHCGCCGNRCMLSKSQQLSTLLQHPLTWFTTCYHIWIQWGKSLRSYRDKTGSRELECSRGGSAALLYRGPGSCPFIP